MKPYVCRHHGLYVAMALLGGVLGIGGLVAIELHHFVGYSLIADPIALISIGIGLLLYLSSLHGHGTYWRRMG